MEICSILSCIQMRNCLIRQMDRMYQMILNYSIHKDRETIIGGQFVMDQAEQL